MGSSMVWEFPEDVWSTADNITSHYRYILTPIMAIVPGMFSLMVLGVVYMVGAGPLAAAGAAVLTAVLVFIGFRRLYVKGARRWFNTPERDVRLPFGETLRLVEDRIGGMDIPYETVELREYPESGGNLGYKDHIREKPLTPPDWRRAVVLDLRGGEEMVIVVQGDEEDTTTTLFMHPFCDDHVELLEGVSAAIDEAVVSRS